MPSYHGVVALIFCQNFTFKSRTQFYTPCIAGKSFCMKCCDEKHKQLDYHSGVSIVEQSCERWSLVERKMQRNLYWCSINQVKTLEDSIQRKFKATTELDRREVHLDGTCRTHKTVFIQLTNYVISNAVVECR